MFGPRVFEYTWSTAGARITVECRAHLEAEFEYDDLGDLAS